MFRNLVTATVGFAVLLIALEGCSGGGGGGSGGPPAGSLTVTLRAMSRLGQPFPNLVVWISIPAGAQYTWSVNANGPLTSLDEETAPTAFFIAGFLPFVSNGTGDAFVGEAPDWGFTFGQ